MEDWRSHREGKPRAPNNRVWFRANGELADDPLLHACLLTYQSDSDLMSTARLPHGRIDRTRMQRASLDHALWFHRDVRVDDWLLYDLDSPSSAGRPAAIVAARCIRLMARWLRSRCRNA